MLRSILAILVLLFLLSEVALSMSRHARGARSSSDDRGSLRLLWIVIMVSVGGAAAFSDYEPMRIHASLRLVQAIALALLAGGLALRWTSVMFLGRYFTVNVTVMYDHRVVDTGPYRYVRHPSYSGLLLAFLGLGLYYNNWLSLVIVIVPVSIALVYRIRIEEAALGAAMGAEYAAYCARTKRLVPGIL
jgi:protein-S-isoprenylcysteine O-methyltransferase